MKNILLASRIQKYPERDYSQKISFETVPAKFRATGSVAYTKQKKTMTIATNNEDEFLVLGSVVENPNTSTRKLARHTGIS